MREKKEFVLQPISRNPIVFILVIEDPHLFFRFLFMSSMDWQQARKKSLRNLIVKWDVFQYGGMQACSTEEVSTIFFSEFPDRIRALDIFKLFGCVDDVVEVVISSRRNKWGRRFSFGRFKGKEDIKTLNVKLDNIMIDGKKIHANQPRFERKGIKSTKRGGSMRSFGKR